MKETPIRKFSPRERFRLMGVTDKDIDKILSTGLSESDLSQIAGNSIVVDVLAEIFKQIYFGNEEQPTLF